MGCGPGQGRGAVGVAPLSGPAFRLKAGLQQDRLKAGPQQTQCPAKGRRWQAALAATRAVRLDFRPLFAAFVRETPGFLPRPSGRQPCRSGKLGRLGRENSLNWKPGLLQ